MNLKATRLVRTPYSEQYALFDLDRTDENYDPLSVGKVDIHYTQQGMYGTLLFWDEADRDDSWDDVIEQRRNAHGRLSEPHGSPRRVRDRGFRPELAEVRVAKQHRFHRR